MASQFSDIGELLERLEGGRAAGPRSGGDSKKKVIESDSPGATAAASASLASSTTGRKHDPVTPASSGHGSAPPARTLSSADRELVAKDELVQRVKDAVDGKLVSVLPVANPEQRTLFDAESEESGDNNATR